MSVTKIEFNTGIYRSEINFYFKLFAKSIILNKLYRCENALIYILNDRLKRSTTSVYGRVCNSMEYIILTQKQKLYQKILEKL